MKTCLDFISLESFMDLLKSLAYRSDHRIDIDQFREWIEDKTLGKYTIVEKSTLISKESST